MEPQQAAGQPHRSRTRLIVDDERKICRLLSQYFSLVQLEGVLARLWASPGPRA